APPRRPRQAGVASRPRPDGEGPTPLPVATAPHPEAQGQAPATAAARLAGASAAARRDQDAPSSPHLAAPRSPTSGSDRQDHVAGAATPAHPGTRSPTRSSPAPDCQAPLPTRTAQT